MQKKFAAIGLSAALVLSPLAALAQNDQTAPAAAAAASDTMSKDAMKKPMKHKKHMSKKMKKPMEQTPTAPAEAPKS